MKHVIPLLLLITLYPHHTLISMDQSIGTENTSEDGTELEYINIDKKPQENQIQTIRPTDSFETTLAQLHSTINKKYESSFLPDFLKTKQLSENDMITIIRMIPINLPYSHKLCDSLYDNNRFFAHAINYFIERAKTNLTFLSMSTITTLEDPEKKQLIPQLDKLPLRLKKDIMNLALGNFLSDDTYIIPLDHGNPVHSFDICETTQQAVTCNKEGSTHNFYLWDLQSGKQTHSFNAKKPINILAFSPNGTYVAAALYNTNTIKIWNTQSKQQLYKLEGPYTIERLAYSPATTTIPSALLVIQKTAKDEKCITECALTTHTVSAGTCSKKMLSHEGRRQKDSFFGSVYEAKHPRLNSSNKNILLITKKCALFHFALLAATKPVSTDTQQNITIFERSQTYQNLTDLEKTKVIEQLQLNCLASK